VRKISNVAVAGIVAIALYFALAWGYDGLRILTSPSYGLEDVWRSQFVFAIGRLFNLGPIGLIKLAAFSERSSSRSPAFALCTSLIGSVAWCAGSRIPKFWKRVLFWR
jgi:hypothetical protein